MGVNPNVYELNLEPRGKEMERALMSYSTAVPVVFIGATDRVIASHIIEELFC